MPIKLLFLTYDVPYPANAGGKIRSYNLIKNLSRHCDITLYTYYRDEKQKNELGDLQKLCSNIIFFKRSKPWDWKNFVYSIFTGSPYMVSLYRNHLLKKQLVTDCINNKFDFVHFESFYPALYLPIVRKYQVAAVMGNENVEYKVYDRYADQKNFFLKYFVKLEVLRMRLFEEKLWKLASLNISISANDADIVESATGRKPLIIPNGVNCKDFFKNIESKSGKKLLFVGSLNYKPNNDAMKFFFQEILPLVKKEIVDIEVEIVSWFKPKWIEKYLDSCVIINQDKKKHSSNFFASSDIFIAPIRVASGTNIKILEAMAGRLPVITTTVGIEGILAGNREVVIADNKNMFAQEIIRLLRYKKERNEIGNAGRELVCRKYEWKEIMKPLIKYYLKT